MAGHAHYSELLSDEELIQLLQTGRLVVREQDNAALRLTKAGLRPIKVEARQNKSHTRPSLRVRIYYANKRRYLEYQRLVWLSRSGCPIPAGWEIHHRNADQLDNRWQNLFCLHPEDHKKLHRPDGGYDDLNEFADTPF